MHELRGVLIRAFLATNFAADSLISCPGKSYRRFSRLRQGVTNGLNIYKYIETSITLYEKNDSYRRPVYCHAGLSRVRV